MTLKDLLTMTAGIRWDETTVDYTDPANSCARMEASKDWIQFVLDQPMAAEPGSTFVYSSGVTELLAEVLRKATGNTPTRTPPSISSGRSGSRASTGRRRRRAIPTRRAAST